MKKYIVWIMLSALALSLSACRPAAREEEGVGDAGILVEVPEETPAPEQNEQEALTDPPPQAAQQTPAPTPDGKPTLGAERPTDFAIFFEWGSGDGNFLDTYNGKVGRDMVAEEDVSAEYVVSEQLLDEIYGALLQYDIADIRTEMTSESLSKDGSISGVSSNTTYLIRFRANSEEYTVSGDATSRFYTEAEGFYDFNGFMIEKIRTIWQELDLPEPTSAYC